MLLRHSILAASAMALIASAALASTPAPGAAAAAKAALPQQVAANELPPASNLAPSDLAPPAPATGVRPGYAISGFRSAQFGMTEDQVKAAISHDFGIQAGKVSTETNPLERTTALIIKTSLPPGPGQATISYIFGASTHRLMHVNVIWATNATPSAADRQSIATAGLQLATYFRTQPWDPKTQVKAGLTQGGLLMFDAADAKGGTVQVEADGIPLSRQVNGKTESNKPTGAAVLRVSYAQDIAHPDVFAIQPGAF
jgi:hypothetical protein